jgi:hypothetical protein
MCRRGTSPAEAAVAADKAAWQAAACRRHKSALRALWALWRKLTALLSLRWQPSSVSSHFPLDLTARPDWPAAARPRRLTSQMGVVGSTRRVLRTLTGEIGLECPQWFKVASSGRADALAEWRLIEFPPAIPGNLSRTDGPSSIDPRRPRAPNYCWMTDSEKLNHYRASPILHRLGVR